MNLRLIIYGDLQSVSGGYRYDRELVAALSNIGHKLSVVSIPRLPYLLTVLHGLTWPIGLKGDQDLTLQDELCHPSLIIPNLIGLARPAVAIVHHLRSSEDLPLLTKPIMQVIERAYLRTVDGFIFNSRATKDAVEDALNASVEGVIAPPAWSGTGPMSGEGHSAPPTERSGPLRILFAGNLIRRKRLDSLLTAIAALPRGEYRLHVAGDPTADRAYTRGIKRLIRKLHLTDHVGLLGSLTEQELARQYRSADVVAVPSQHEGFGRVYLEAHAYGLPVIGSKSGGAGEIVVDGVTGWLVDPDDSDSIARHLRTLKGDPRQRAAMGAAARERFNRHPTWPQNAERVAAYLEQLASRSDQNRASAPHRIRHWKRRMSNE